MLVISNKMSNCLPWTRFATLCYIKTTLSCLKGTTQNLQSASCLKWSNLQSNYFTNLAFKWFKLSRVCQYGSRDWAKLTLKWNVYDCKGCKCSMFIHSFSQKLVATCFFKWKQPACWLFFTWKARGLPMSSPRRTTLLAPNVCLLSNRITDCLSLVNDGRTIQTYISELHAPPSLLCGLTATSHQVDEWGASTPFWYLMRGDWDEGEVEISLPFWFLCFLVWELFPVGWALL